LFKTQIIKGLFLKTKLTFQEHISILEGKVARSLGILFKLKHVGLFPQATLQQLYFALIQPLLVYGIWNSNLGSHLSYVLVPKKNSKSYKKRHSYYHA